MPRVPAPRHRLRAAVPAAVLVLLTLLVAGCSTRVRTTGEASPGLADDLAGGVRVALGGVVVAPQLGATLAPADRQDAEAALYRAVLTARPDLQVWPVPAVVGATDPDALAALRASYAERGVPAPTLVAAVAADLGQPGYLALARLLDDQVRSHAQRQDAQNPEARAEGLPEHDSAWATTVSVEREITIELTLVDLGTGQIAWQGSADARDRQRYAYEDPLGGDPVAWVKDRLAAAAAAEPRHLSRRGDSLQRPDLVALVEQGLTGLVERLPAPEAP